MKKIIKILVTFLPVLSYILFAQILFPNKYANFDEVYSADRINVINESNDAMKITERYQENDLYYLEIVTTPEITIEMYTDIYINGTNFENETLTVKTDSNNILIESKSEINVTGKVALEEVNAALAINNVSISVGTILGILILFGIVKSEFSTETKITITLAVMTVVFYMLSSIVTDIFWVLLTADAGWVAGLGVGLIPSKKDKKNKKRTEKLDNFLGNV